MFESPASFPVPLLCKMATKAPPSPSTTRPTKPSPTLGRKKQTNDSFHQTRAFLLKQVARGTPVIQKLQVCTKLARESVKYRLTTLSPSVALLARKQRFRSKWLDSYFIISSFLGDQVLYTYLLAWCVDIAIFRRFSPFRLTSQSVV